MSSKRQMSKSLNFDTTLDDVSIYSFKRCNDKYSIESNYFHNGNHLKDVLQITEIGPKDPKTDVINYLELEEFARNSTAIYQESKHLLGYSEWRDNLEDETSTNFLSKIENANSPLLHRQLKFMLKSNNQLYINSSFGNEIDIFLKSNRQMKFNLNRKESYINSVMSKYQKSTYKTCTTITNCKEGVHNYIATEDVNISGSLYYTAATFAERKRSYNYMVKKSIIKSAKQFINARNIITLNFKKVCF